MRIEMLESVKHDTPSGWEFVEGEQRTVDDKTGRYFCAMGWARDLEGQVPTGERATGPTVLDVDDAGAASSSQTT